MRACSCSDLQQESAVAFPLILSKGWWRIAADSHRSAATVPLWAVTCDCALPPSLVFKAGCASPHIPDRRSAELCAQVASSEL